MEAAVRDFEAAVRVFAVAVRKIDGFVCCFGCAVYDFDCGRRGIFRPFVS
jgi:hypothetical protein